jgi:5,10-methylenetetrahydromethanopterin reductase
MKVSCFFAPQPDTARHIELAEQLGFHRAWCFDTPALCSDIWVALARAAERTSTIQLATGMLIPALRHVLANASAIAELAQLAPGRVSIGVATGLTGLRMLGRRRMTWKSVEQHVAALRGLLAGEEVEWEGARIKLDYPTAYGKRLAPGPVEVPFIVAAEGPRGMKAAREIGAGLVTNGPVPEGFDEVIRVLFGTVLDDGEPPTSNRARAAAGPGAAFAYHAAYEFGGGPAIDQLPGGRAWREDLERVPTERRRRAHWYGHLIEMSTRDEIHIPPEMITNLAVVGTPAEMRQRMAAWEAEGVTEAAFTPAGDIERELRQLSSALGLHSGNTSTTCDPAVR